MPKKESSSPRYAIIALGLAAIGCVATAGLGLVKGSVALGLYTPARPESLNQWLAASGGLLIIGLALYAILNPDGTRRFFTGRRARYGSNALVMSVAFIGILLIVNWLVYQNPKKWDWSEGKQHTLAPETLRALNTLPEKVTAIAFFSTQYPADTAKSLLGDFKSSSNGKFDFRFVDPNADPVLAQQYGITGDGRIVLVMGDQKETATYADESILTEAMIRLISPQARVVYFLTGHGEPELESAETASMSRAKQTLESKNYTVKQLNLAAANSIPEDAKAIIVAGPIHPLLEQEAQQLAEFSRKGGALIVMIDPAPFTQTGDVKDPLQEWLSSDWGIMLQDDVVIDLTSNQPFSAISASYSSEALITSHTTSFTIMPEARSLAVGSTAPADVKVTPLILTSEQSWGETDLAGLQGNQEVAFDEATDLPGPLTVAAQAENSKTKGRLVVFGDSSFASDEGFSAYANGEIFTNAVDWAAQETDLINITPREPVTRTFNPPGQFPYILILLGSVFVIPGLILLAGISSWLTRRRHG